MKYAAEELILFLVETFYVDIETGQEARRNTSFLVWKEEAVDKSVRIVPRETPGATAITYNISKDFSVLLNAGNTTSIPFPDCGCDGCDDDVDSWVESLVCETFGIVAGNLRESLNSGVSGASYELPILFKDGSYWKIQDNSYLVRDVDAPTRTRTDQPWPLRAKLEE